MRIAILCWIVLITRRDLVEHVAIEIDWRSFEEIGIDPRQALYPELGTDSAGTTARVAASPEDPFASTAVSIPQPAVHKKKIAIDSMWWRQQKYSSSSTVVSTAARLLFFLGQLDATITIRQGQLIMTTVEGADQQCCVRVYDVTPMIGVDSPSRSVGDRWHRGSMVDGQSLIDTIQMAVDSDTWECMGGPSSLHTVACRDRQWLVAATPLVTHWKIQALLDKLNQ